MRELGSEAGVRGSKGGEGGKVEQGYATLGLRVPTTCEDKKFDYDLQCLGVPTTCKWNHHPIYTHRTAKALCRSPPPAQNFGAKNTKSTTKVTLTSHQSIPLGQDINSRVWSSQIVETVFAVNYVNLEMKILFYDTE